MNMIVAYVPKNDILELCGGEVVAIKFQDIFEMFVRYGHIGSKLGQAGVLLLSLINQQVDNFGCSITKGFKGFYFVRVVRHPAIFIIRSEFNHFFSGRENAFFYRILVVTVELELDSGVKVLW